MIILAAINAKFIHSSLAIHSLRACLGEEAKHVHIREFTVNQPESLIISELFKLKPEILAFSCYIWNIGMVLSIAGAIKQIMPGVRIIAGGPEVSYISEGEDLLAHGIDEIVSGEGESAFRQLVSGYLSSTGQKTRPVEFSDIPFSELTFPYLDGFDGFANRIIYYESSRGCPNSCGYCLAGLGAGVQFLPPERVRAELSEFMSAKVPQVKFVDRTFNCDKRHAMDIWQHLIASDNGVTNFHFEIAGDLLDDEMVGLIGRARPGLFQFEIGVQSTNPKTLAAIGRSTDTSRLLENVRKLKNIGNVHLHLDLIIGLPYEDMPSFTKSFNDVMAVRPDQLQVGFLKLLKGSALRKDAKKYGIKFNKTAPYEILASDFMGYEVIDRLKKVEHMVDLFYNSGGFQAYIRYMVTQYESDYDFYDALAGYWDSNGYHMVSHKKTALYTILYEFGGKGRLVSELLKYDMLTRENVRTFPIWIEEYYRYDHKKVSRDSAVHTFEYDIDTWERREVETRFGY